MRALAEAVEIVDFKLAVAALTVEGLTPLDTRIIWRNDTLVVDTVIVGFILGKITETGFDVLTFSIEVQPGLYKVYCVGYCINGVCPPRGWLGTWPMGYRAYNVAALATYDAQVFVARGTITTLSYEGRGYAIDAEEFVAATRYTMKNFLNAITIIPKLA